MVIIDDTRLHDRDRDGMRTIITAPGVIKAGPGRLLGIVVLNGGTSGGGSFVLNDCEAIENATAVNTLFTLPAGAEIGTVIKLSFPFYVGLVLSDVPLLGAKRIVLAYE